MDLENLLTSLNPSSSAVATSPVLRALWFDRQNKWDEAHEAIQHENGTMAAAVHAYLHRKEGDIWNANYWYRNARRKPFEGNLHDEWEALVEEECERLGLLKRTA
jgi:hypothetical protein